MQTFSNSNDAHTNAESGPALSREQWLARCAARFREVAALDETFAIQMAEAQLELLKDDLTENPEQAADDEMSYWIED